ncbi:MAG: hypothetical protein KAR05_10500 [Candidatus Omnitrophica bacterium]|nr:hypothetical protein [Candidatus Omnitrophota bacterium]
MYVTLLKSKVFFITALLGVTFWGGFTTAEAYQRVKIESRQLVVDYDMDGTYEPFFVKGVNYAPTPVGHFIGRGDGWSADCWYTGPFPLNYPELRFEHSEDSPDGAYACGDVGSNFYQDPAVFNRDFTLLKDMNANTIRTWGDVTPELLQKAREHGLKVIAGYWINHNIDYTFPLPDGPSQRMILMNDFVNYVNTFKNDSAILMWGLSNENNLNFCNECYPHGGTSCDRTAQATGYYQLMNDLAQAARNAEGSSFHPVIVVSAELTQDVIDHADHMTNVNIVGINAYRGRNFDGWPNPNPNLFEEFENHFPTKSLIITEFGVDAWDSGDDFDHPEDGSENPDDQADWVTSAWNDIEDYAVQFGGPCNGGVVFNYSDQWNGYALADPHDACAWVSSDWTPSVRTQDHGFTDPAVLGIGSMPDNKFNPEWAGLMTAQKSPISNNPDIMTPRSVYYSLKNEFSDTCSLSPGHLDYCLPSQCGPCGARDGDCDNDSECQSGLICAQDVGADYGWSPTIDVCEQPDGPCAIFQSGPDWCRDCGPCSEGQGDCDGDNECQNGLICAQDVGANYGWPSSRDVCEQPN